MPQSLVVGANGQVGAALTSVLGSNALPAGRLASSEIPLVIDLAALASNPSLAPGLLAPLAIDAVYCVGGATDVERCETDHDWAYAANCHGPAALAAAARHLPFVFFSTDYVFPGTAQNPGPYTEDAPTNPLSIYGKSKLLGEQAVLTAHPDALIIRTTTVFGPDKQRKNFLYTLQRLLSEGKPMRVAADQLSTPTYNADLAATAIALVQAHATGIVNVAGPDLLSRFDFALLAAGLLSLDPSLLSPIDTSELNQRAPRPLHSGLDTTRLSALLGHNPMHSTADAVIAWKTNLA